MNAILKIDDAELTPARLTCADVMTMVETGVLHEGRGHELIEGVLVEMAAQYGPHVAAVRGLLKFLFRTLDDSVDINSAPSIPFSETVLLEPDICIGPAGIVSTDLRGPDILLAIEISDTTRGFDLGKKATLYAQHGVADYWVVDLVENSLIRHSDPQQDGYRTVEQTDWTSPAALPFAPEVTLTLGDLIRT